MDEPPTGIPIPLEPIVTRVLAPNPSAYTYTGTQSYIVGGSDLVVIDPGPANEAHHAALLAAIGGRPVLTILVTHHHRDHSPGALRLKAETGASIVGASPAHVADDDDTVDAAFDADYAPDRVLGDGDRVSGDGWTLEAVATPGHTSNHLAFALPQTNALFTGDHVMGWSTSVVSPPDGDMAAYMASLNKLMGRDDRVYYPGHGDAVEKPRRLVRGLLGHRRQREGQILRLLRSGTGAIPTMVEKMYAGITPKLFAGAERSVLAHLIDLERRGLAKRDEVTWTVVEK